jgi:hypothetical protein
VVFLAPKAPERFPGSEVLRISEDPKHAKFTVDHRNMVTSLLASPLVVKQAMENAHLIMCIYIV